MKKQLFWLGCGAVLCAANGASAHINLASHDGRNGNQKLGPCEGEARGGMVYTYEPGETITVAVDEYIPHPGWFRIAFDADGEDDLLPPSSIDPPEFDVNDAVLMDNLDPHDSGGGMRSWEVTLPDVECDNCTLQVIQVMLDKLPYDPQDTGAFSNDIYYRCIDIELVRSETEPEMPAETDPEMMSAEMNPEMPAETDPEMMSPEMNPEMPAETAAPEMPADMGPPAMMAPESPTMDPMTPAQMPASPAATGAQPVDMGDMGDMAGAGGTETPATGTVTSAVQATPEMSDTDDSARIFDCRIASAPSASGWLPIVASLLSILWRRRQTHR